MNTHTREHATATGFTLIELLLVVVILGILAGVVIGQVNAISEDAQRSAFISSGQIFQEAAYRYYLDNGSYPENRASGKLPDGFGYYITSQQWESGTPIGGLWDMSFDQYGVTSSLGVHFKTSAGPRKDDAYMQQIDASIDDGDLTTGVFQKVGGKRYYFILAE